MDDFQDFRKLIKEEKYEDAYNIGKELLKKESGISPITI